MNVLINEKDIFIQNGHEIDDKQLKQLKARFYFSCDFIKPKNYKRCFKLMRYIGKAKNMRILSRHSRDSTTNPEIKVSYQLNLMTIESDPYCLCRAMSHPFFGKLRIPNSICYCHSLRDVSVPAGIFRTVNYEFEVLLHREDKRIKSVELRENGKSREITVDCNELRIENASELRFIADEKLIWSTKIADFMYHTKFASIVCGGMAGRGFWHDFLTRGLYDPRLLIRIYLMT